MEVGTEIISEVNKDDQNKEQGMETDDVVADDTAKESSKSQVEEIALDQTEVPKEDKKEVLQKNKNEDVQDKADVDIQKEEMERESKKADVTIVDMKQALITTEKQSTQTVEDLDEKPKPADETTKVVKEDSKKTDETQSDKKTENEKTENLELDDLLRISVICDVDEQDDKADNAESENGQEENTCSSYKDDAIKFDESIYNSNLPFVENSITNNDNVPVNTVSGKSYSIDSSDSGASKEDVEMVDILKKVIAEISAISSNKELSTEALNQTIEEKSEGGIESSLHVPEEPVIYLDLDKPVAEQKKILEVNSPCGKRSVSQDHEKNVTMKKMRLSESPVKDDITTKKTEGDDRLKMLTSFESFMRTKIFNKKLTKTDLEQFCIQKICEVIMHKTELGELNQLVRTQKQMHEQLRRDIDQLTKQNRDLEIVNKKLIKELKSQNGEQIPLVPLKISRSVGLQVNLTVSTEENRKGAPTPSIRTTPTISNNTTPVNNNRSRTVPQASYVVRQVTPTKTASRKPQKASGSTTSIHSHALQTPSWRQSTTLKRPVLIRPKPAAQSTNKPSNPGVIDLTNENYRPPKTPGGTYIKRVNKQMVTTSKLVIQKTAGKSPNNQTNMVNFNEVKSGQVVKKDTPNRTVKTLPQCVYLASPTMVKNNNARPVTSTTAGPQLMYVAQPLSQLVTTTTQGGQKNFLLKFQPGNSILTSPLNESAVSLISNKANVQVNTAPTPSVHPAPLPLPPTFQPIANLKPLLPKPHLSIRKIETGIILQWRMPYNLDIYESIASYQLFAYQETNTPPSTDMWHKVSDVKALALPMACTLTQFADNTKYYFAIRCVDAHNRIGAFSDLEEISL